MTKRALRREQRVTAILESAVAAFRRDGYHGTTMEAIAAELLMTKGSLYYYFRDKEEILFAVHDPALDRLLAELARVKRRRVCPCERLEDLLASHIRIMVEGFHGTALALEFGPKVRVNQVTVGLVLTEMAAEYYGDSEGQQAIAGLIPAGRLAVPGDVADACLLLASPLAGYVSGAELRLDGGGEIPGRFAVLNPLAVPAPT